MLRFDEAQAIMQRVFDAAAKDKLDSDIAVAIADAHGELLCFSHKDNAAFHAGVLARNKAYTAARDRQATSSLGAWAKETGKDMGYWADGRITGIAGGVPILQDGSVIGAIGVSGLDEWEDERLALAGL